jgi:hypothetical protein
VVTVNPIPPPPTINPSGPTTFCAGDSVILTSSAASGNNWSNAATTPAITVTTAGAYTVYQVQLGCTSAVSLPTTVIVNPLPSPPTISQVGNLLTATPAAASYQWYLNGSIIPGATSQTYIALQSGNYTVVITDANGCSSSQSTVYMFTGLDSALRRALSLSPNPNSGTVRLRVDLPSLTSARVSILNLEGKAVYEAEFLGLAGRLDQEFDLGAVTAGMYFLRFETESEVVTLKMIVER